MKKMHVTMLIGVVVVVFLVGIHKLTYKVEDVGGKIDNPIYLCESDTDCIKVAADCCNLQSTAVNRNYDVERETDCSCPAWRGWHWTSDRSTPKCVDNICVLVGRDKSELGGFLWDLFN